MPQPFSSDTNSHDQFFAAQRLKARQHVVENLIKHEYATNQPINNMIKHNKFKQVNILDSSQRTSIISSGLSKSTIERTAYSIGDKNDVKSALNRVRNSGCIPPKKKNNK
jgi:hypothetical protein